MVDVANTWTSVADVAAFTGATVDAEAVVIAQASIEGLINRVYRVSDAGTADEYWLRRAVSWQARYVSEHPEVFAMVGGLTSLSQDGMSATWGGGAQGQGDGGARHISPVARTFLNNLRAGANTSLRVNSAFDRGNRRGPTWRRIGRR